MKDKKIAKKKKREKAVKKKIVARRIKTREEAREERIEKREEHRLRERIIPYVNPEKVEMLEDREQAREFARIERSINSDIEETKMTVLRAKNKGMAEEIISRLENNYEILLALRDEFLEEKERREAVNEELEEKGVSTLKEKMELLSKEAIETQKSEMVRGELQECDDAGCSCSHSYPRNIVEDLLDDAAKNNF